MVQADEVPAADDGAVNVPSSTPVSGDAMPIDDVIARLRDIAANRSEDGTWYAANGGTQEATTEWIAADLLERLRSQVGAPEPTDDMAEAGRDWAQREWKASGDPKGYLDFYRGIYRAMLSAAPQPPVSQPPGTDRSALASSVMPDKEAAAAAYFRSAIADGEAAVLLNDLATYDNVLRELGIQESHTHPVDEVRRVQSLAETGHTRGVESAAKLIDRKVLDYTSEHGSLDPETGAMEFSRSGEEYVSTLEELAEEIRSSLAPGAVQPPEGGTGWREGVTVPVDLAKEIWSAVKEVRDQHAFAELRSKELSGLLQRMKQAGLANWIPTLEEVQAAGPYVRVGLDETLEHATLRTAPSPPGQDDRTNSHCNVEINVLRNALEGLLDVQNGPPLIRDQAAWEWAVQEARRVLANYIDEPAALPRKDVEGAAYRVGDRVEKYTGEAMYVGTVVSVYLTVRGKLRYVVDVEPQHFQMISNEAQLRPAIRDLGKQTADTEQDTGGERG